MNAKDRKELQRALDLLDDARIIIESIAEREQEKFDNLPEAFQNSERGEKMQEAASELESCTSEISDIHYRIEEQIQ